MLPKISSQIHVDDVKQILNDNFSEIIQEWMKHQVSWITGAYEIFKDQEKFLIVIYLIKKTLNFYSLNFIKISYDDFFTKDRLEIGKINISEISKDLNLPKETARRKIVELEKIGVIKRKNKTIFIYINMLRRFKKENSPKKIAFFLSKFSEFLTKYQILNKSFKSDYIYYNFLKNFSRNWEFYYELQISILNRWRACFKDLETYQIWAMCIVSGSYNLNLRNQKRAVQEYLETIALPIQGTGINAMTVSDMTGIPRATVVRKLKNLVKKNFLVIDGKKLYYPANTHIKNLRKLNKKNMELLSVFITKIFNQILNSPDLKK